MLDSSEFILSVSDTSFRQPPSHGGRCIKEFRYSFRDRLAKLSVSLCTGERAFNWEGKTETDRETEKEAPLGYPRDWTSQSWLSWTLLWGPPASHSSAHQRAWDCSGWRWKDINNNNNNNNNNKAPGIGYCCFSTNLLNNLGNVFRCCGFMCPREGEQIRDGLWSLSSSRSSNWKEGK